MPSSFIDTMANASAKIGKLALLMTFLFWPSSVVNAVTLAPFEVATKLQETYEKASSVTAEFKQTTAMKFSARTRQGSGTMIFNKPGRMRWDYSSPDYQVLISDGETISMYFEKSRQMIISNAKEYLQSDVTYSFFAGTGDILKDFDVSPPDFKSNSEDLFLLKLTPKFSHPHVSTIHAWITHDTFLIKQLQIVDHFDTVTDLFFDNVQIDSGLYNNQKITDDLFLFIPPADTEVIEQY